MQAIVVKYIGPTNTRGARMRATNGTLTATIAYDHEKHIEWNAEKAARELIQKLGWFPTQAHPHACGPFWAMGTLPNGDYVFVNHSGKPYVDLHSIDTRNWDYSKC